MNPKKGSAIKLAGMLPILWNSITFLVDFICPSLTLINCMINSSG